MIGLLWEWGTCGTLSLDFPVLAEEEIVGPGPRESSQVPSSVQALTTSAGHCILASLHL